MSTHDLSIVEPHAAALEACAAKMEAAGIGCHPSDGHVVALRKMAGAIRADAATGKMPYSYTGLYAAAAGKPAAAPQELTPFLKRMMASANLEAPPPGKAFSVSQVDEALTTAAIPSKDRLALKIALERAGMMV